MSRVQISSILTSTRILALDMKILEIHMRDSSHITKLVGCGLAIMLGWESSLYHMVLGNSEPHLVCMQVNTYYPWVSVDVSTQVYPWGDHVTNFHGLTIVICYIHTLRVPAQ